MAFYLLHNYMDFIFFSLDITNLNNIYNKRLLFLKRRLYN
ncbi:hypothetical protein EFM1_31770 [Enterococcus faecium]|nr:hypothetical protein EFM1_31770 [Enterococcus faecium]